MCVMRCASSQGRERALRVWQSVGGSLAADCRIDVTRMQGPLDAMQGRTRTAHRAQHGTALHTHTHTHTHLNGSSLSVSSLYFIWLPSRYSTSLDSSPRA